MSHLNFLVLLIFFSFSSQLLFSQNDRDLYLQKAGFTETRLNTKTDSIYFLTSINNSVLPKATILFIQGSKPLPLIFYDDESTNSIIPFDIKPYLKKYKVTIYYFTVNKFVLP